MPDDYLKDDRISVEENIVELWKIEVKLTDNIADVLNASGTKYAAIFKPLGKIRRDANAV